MLFVNPPPVLLPRGQRRRPVATAVPAATTPISVTFVPPVVPSTAAPKSTTGQDTRSTLQETRHAEASTGPAPTAAPSSSATSVPPVVPPSAVPGTTTGNVRPPTVRKRKRTDDDSTTRRQRKERNEESQVARLRQHPRVIAWVKAFEESILKGTQPLDFCELSPDNSFRKYVTRVSEILEAGRARHSGFVHSEYAPANESDNKDFYQMAHSISRATLDIRARVSAEASFKIRYNAVLALLEIGTRILQAYEQVVAGLKDRDYLESPLNVPQTLREIVSFMKRDDAPNMDIDVVEHAGELYILSHEAELKVWLAGMSSVCEMLEEFED